MTDQFTPVLTYLVVACMGRDRYFDLDAVRHPNDRVAETPQMDRREAARREVGLSSGNNIGKGIVQNPAGAPPLDWWTDPQETVWARLVDSMCPRRVCVTCGEPSRRIVDVQGLRGQDFFVAATGENDRGQGLHGTRTPMPDITRTTLGWTDCGHNNYRDGSVLHLQGDNMGARYLVGDVFDGLRSLPDNSVDLVMTSPPFLALRSYLPADHPDKAKEIGSEPTPGEFIDTLLDVVVELRRVLAPHGSMVFELGDTFSGSGGAGGDYSDDGLRSGQPKFKANTTRYTYGEKDGGRTDSGPSDLQVRNSGGRGWPLDKSLCLIPQSFAWALSYGRNPFTGREIEPWRVRNVVAWCRPNPPVGALGDKFRPATSYLTVACTSRDRYFDLDAVRTEPSRDPATMMGGTRPAGHFPGGGGDDARAERGELHSHGMNPAGAPPLDYWVIPTQPYAGSHYATYPTALVTKPVEAMCPRKVCRVCGAPSRRITERTEDYAAARASIGDFNQRDAGQGSSGSRSVLSNAAGRDITCAENVTVGWTDCGHDDYRPGVVLDPFAGSGTTLQVALGHGRDAIGIDLDERNAELAYERIGGLFLNIEHLAESAA